MTTLCTCWRINRSDGGVEGYTDHDRNLLIGGVLYEAASGFAPSAVERSATLQSNTQTLAGVIDSARLSESDLRAGVYTGARVTVFLADWADSTAAYTLLVGHLGTVSIQDGQYSAELLSIEHELTKPIGRTAQARCDADLGDTRCGYELSPASGTVAAVTGDKRVFTDTGRAEADGYYTAGKLTWSTGQNAGRTMDIRRYVAGTQTIELAEPMPAAIVSGDTYAIYRGCDKTFATCRDAFDNAARFRGLPFVPGVTNLTDNNLGD